MKKVLKFNNLAYDKKQMATQNRKDFRKLYRTFKKLGGKYSDFDLKAYNSTGAKKIYEDYIQKNNDKSVTRGDFYREAKALGYTGKYNTSTKANLMKYINKDIGLSVDIKYIKLTGDENGMNPEDLQAYINQLTQEKSDRLKTKTINVRSKMNIKQSDVDKLTERFKSELGGYGLIIDKVFRETAMMPKNDIYNVSMKDRYSPKLITFDYKGELVADYIQNHNDQCVLDFICDGYMTKYGHKGKDTTRNIMLMDKQELAEEISNLYNEKSVKTCTCGCPLNCDCTIKTYDALTDGVSVLQLDSWCKKKNIGLRVLDNNMKQISTFIGSHKIQPMYIIQDNGHLYPIVSKEIRDSLAQSGRYVKKERDKQGNIKDKKKKEIKYDYMYYKFENIDKLLNDCNHNKNTKLIIEDNVLESVFLDFLVTRNEQYSVKYRSNILTDILLPNGNSIIFNEDVVTVIEICKILDISFENQSIIGLTNSVLKTLSNEEQPLNKLSSNFTSDILETLKNDLPCHNWVKSHEKYAMLTNTKAYDINKAYSSIIEDKGMNWLTLDIASTIQDFDGLISDNKLFYVTKTDDLLFQNTGWYFHNLVITGLKDGLITSDDIKYQIVGKSQQTDMFNKLVEYLYDKFNTKIAKTMINLYVGNLGRTHKTVGYTRWTTSLDQAFSDLKTSESFVFTETHKDKIVYKISNTKINEIDSINFINQRQVVQTGYLKVYNLIKSLTKNKDSKLIAVKTDCVYVQNPSFIKLSDERGGIKQEKISSSAFEKCTTIVNNVSYEERTFDTKLRDIKQIEVKDEYNIDNIVDKIIDGKNVLLTGRAGCGKSHILKKLIKKLQNDDVNIKIGAPTHQAKKLLGEKAKTVHNLFGHDIFGKIHNVKFNDKCTIILDEVSMIQTEFWSSIIKIHRQQPSINFILCGDFNQLPAVGEEHIDVYNSRFLRDIIDYQLDLTVNKRCSKDSQIHFDIMTQAINNGKINYAFEKGNDDIVNHLCFTNEKRKSINNKLMLKLRGENYKECGDIFVYKNLPMICKKNFRGKNNINLNNGDRFTVTSFDDKNIYTDIDTVIPIYKDFHIDFQPAYAITVHSSQGTTIKENYMLHEIDKYTNKMLYVALSRCSDLKLIHV